MPPCRCGGGCGVRGGRRRAARWAPSSAPPGRRRHRLPRRPVHGPRLGRAGGCRASPPLRLLRSLRQTRDALRRRDPRGLTGLLIGGGGVGLARAPACRSSAVRHWPAALAKDPLGPCRSCRGRGPLAGRQAQAAPVWLPAAGIVLALVLDLAGTAGLRNPGFLWYTVVDNHRQRGAAARLPDEDVPLSALGCHRRPGAFRDRAGRPHA